jgi:hypothetical protein
MTRRPVARGLTYFTPLSFNSANQINQPLGLGMKDNTQGYIQPEFYTKISFYEIVVFCFYTRCNIVGHL